MILDILEISLFKFNSIFFAIFSALMILKNRTLILSIKREKIKNKIVKAVIFIKILIIEVDPRLINLFFNM